MLPLGMLPKTLFVLFLFSSFLFSNYEEKIEVLYNSLHQESLMELLAFYHLYQGTKTGEKAYREAWKRINLHREHPVEPKQLKLYSLRIQPIIALVTKEPCEKTPLLSTEELKIIDSISDHLSHHKLKGHSVWDKKDLLSLPDEEIDLARAILLHQFEKEEIDQIRSYEACLDIMAIQILSKLPKNYTDIQVLEAINQFIFHEMRYRFPPHSMWVKDVDLYTFLPSVLDSRHGVCLGVSILYLSLAQRLNLPLDIITPPGHIYLSYKMGDKTINIETTARGIDLPSETYLSINTKSLKNRSLKEVIGLNFLNAAATAWQKKVYSQAIVFYQQAQPYLKDDPLLQTFLGFNFLFVGKIEEGEALLKHVQPEKEQVYPDTTIEDYFLKRVDIAGIQAIYQAVDETRESILDKQETLKKTLQKYPTFREGIFHLAITWLQLGRKKEALETLKQYQKIDTNNPIVAYYLATLFLQRWEYQEAYKHLTLCRTLLEKKNHSPKALFFLEKECRHAGVFSFS